MTDLNDQILGKSDSEIKIDSSQDNRRLACALLSQAKRTIDIYTHHLDKAIFDDADFIAALKRLVINHSKARARILVVDSQPAVKQGHRLINLGQQVTSKIKFNSPATNTTPPSDAFIVVDNTGLIYRPQGDRFHGHANFHAPNEARELLARFESLWENSTPDPYIRRLHI